MIAPRHKPAPGTTKRDLRHVIWRRPNQTRGSSVLLAESRAGPDAAGANGPRDRRFGSTSSGGDPHVTEAHQNPDRQPRAAGRSRRRLLVAALARPPPQ